VGNNTTLGDDDVAEELLEPGKNDKSDGARWHQVKWHVLLIVADGELQVTGNNTLLLVVAGGVASKLEDLGSEVLEDCSKVD